MNLRIRHRLIGFLLLLILAAVLAPLVLRSPDQVRHALDLSIPEAPQASVPDPAPVVDKAQEEELVGQIKQDRETVLAASKQVLESSDSVPSGSEPSGSDPDTGSQSQPAEPEPAMPTAGFVIQVASFKQADNAGDLVERLRDAGYKAYQRSASTPEGSQWHRVFLGPVIRHDDALALQRKLADDEHFSLPSGLVRSYVP